MINQRQAPWEGGLQRYRQKSNYIWGLSDSSAVILYPADRGGTGRKGICVEKAKKYLLDLRLPVLPRDHDGGFAIRDTSHGLAGI